MHYFQEGKTYIDARKSHRGKAEVEGLSRSGETEEAQEEGMAEVPMSDCSPASMEAVEEEEDEETDSCEGRKSVGRKSPKEHTKAKKRRARKVALPVKKLVRALRESQSPEWASQKPSSRGTTGRGESAEGALR